MERTKSSGGQETGEGGRESKYENSIMKPIVYELIFKMMKRNIKA